MPRLLSTFLALLLLVPAIRQTLRAQEVDCTIQVDYRSVPTTNRDLLRDFASDLQDYVNNYKWGPDNLAEKVKCTMSIFIQTVTGENKYQAQVFIGSQRRIFPTDKNSAVVRLFDESWEFTYVKNVPLTHDLYSFGDLTSFLDFYIYVILGYDYDTYDPMGGTPLFQKAMDVANLGRASGLKGWQPSTSSYSRFQLIDELANPKFEPLRLASYRYHFAGLDSLATNPDRAYANMIQALQSIGTLRKQADPRSPAIKAFFDTKYMEIAETFKGYSDASIYTLFSQIDPSHTQTYEEARNRKTERKGERQE